MIIFFIIDDYQRIDKMSAAVGKRLDLPAPEGVGLRF